MSMTCTTTAADPSYDTHFYKVLRWRVHNPEEALALANSHRAQAADARASKPVSIDSFYDQSRDAGCESRASTHDEMADICERHAANLQDVAATSVDAPASLVEVC